MGTWRVGLSEQAERDLEEAVAFVATKNRVAAERIGLELVDVIFSLSEFPARGAAMKNRPGLRKTVHRHYQIIFRVREAASLVEIVRIWDGRRDPMRLDLP